MSLRLRGRPLFRASSAGPTRRWHHVIPVKTLIFCIFAVVVELYIFHASVSFESVHVDNICHIQIFYLNLHL